MYNRGGNGKPRGFGFSSFSLGKKADSSRDSRDSSHSSSSQNASSAGVNRQGYMGMNTISQNAVSSSSYGVPIKRHKNEEEYFDEDEDEDNPGRADRSSKVLEYIPAPGSPTLDRYGAKNQSDESDDDPLDAFMQGIESQVKKEQEKSEKQIPVEIVDNKTKARGVRDDIEEEDDEESYYRYMEENPTAGLPQVDSDVELEYDEDGNPIAPKKSKYIDPLPPIDHSTITYNEFEKNFYEEHPDIAALNPSQVEDLKKKLGLKVSGASPPKPVTSFAHFGLDEALMKAIRKSEYTQPTPIQAQGIPIALMGRDIIGIAKTGSGKTAAFIWPMLVHIMDQKELQPEEGPIGLILAPTRELSQQIYNEAKRFGKVYNIRVVCCYGGGSKWEQTKDLKDGAEIVVATPGRMIDLVKLKATNLQRVTFLVLDEADRMFDMGFEPQVRSICDHVRPDRQTLMFSATFKKKVEKLARHALVDAVRVVQGDVGEANEDVTQYIKLFPVGPEKWTWVTTKLVEFTSIGSVLIFVTRKDNSEELAENLRKRDFEVGLLHGDIDQTERNKIITAFKKKEMPILVATDVAARGLDIAHIKTVINYDVARDIDTHTHRVGRTGRAGEKGEAYTLVTEKDKEFAGHLVRNLEGANQEVPDELMELALQSSWFRKSRFKGGKGKKMSVGGKGLGFKERPGFGLSSTGNSSTSSANNSEKKSYASKQGPGGDRLSSMKASFQNQYKQQFCLASTDTLNQTSSVEYNDVNSRVSSSTHFNLLPPPPPPPPPPSLPQTETPSNNEKSRKRSRWDN